MLHKTKENLTVVFYFHRLIQNSQERKTDGDEMTWESDESPIETTNHEDSHKGKKFISNFFHQKKRG